MSVFSGELQSVNMTKSGLFKHPLKDSSLVSALMMVELTGAYPKASTILAPACWWRFCIYFLFFRSCGLPPRWRSGSARDD